MVPYKKHFNAKFQNMEIYINMRNIANFSNDIYNNLKKR